MKKTSAIHWAVLGLFLASMVSLGACNTVEGMGQDVESAGEGIQEGADDVQKKL